MQKMIGPRKIGRYSNDFKVKAVRLTFIEGTQIQEVAGALDIHPFMLSRWRKEYREGKFVADRRVKKVVDGGVQARDGRLKVLLPQRTWIFLGSNYTSSVVAGVECGRFGLVATGV